MCMVHHSNMLYRIVSDFVDVLIAFLFIPLFSHSSAYAFSIVDAVIQKDTANTNTCVYVAIIFEMDVK